MGSQLKASVLASTLGALLSCRAAVNYVRTKFFIVIILSLLSCRLAAKEGKSLFLEYLDHHSSFTWTDEILSPVSLQTLHLSLTLHCPAGALVPAGSCILGVAADRDPAAAKATKAIACVSSTSMLEGLRILF